MTHQKSLIFGIGCWYLWKARNEWVFSAISQSHVDLAARISNWKHIVDLAQSRDNILGSQPLPRRTVAIEWDPGPEGWVTVNTDGSVVQPSGNTSTGGLIRDHLGHCSLAFSANLGKCSITRAEMRGILHGLEEGNGAADFLANMGHCFDPGIQIVPTSDCNLGYFLRKDCMRIAELRRIPIIN
ncbi:Putative ribonuclease H protein At1g65750 [Linum perenne]